MSQLLERYTPVKGVTPKEPILFIHGMWSNGNAWDYWIPAFNQSGYQSWTSDLIPRTGNTSILDYVEMIKDDVDCVKRACGTYPILVGHSMGGLIAQLTASEIQIPATVLLASVGPSGIFNIRWPLLRNLWPYTLKILCNRPLLPSVAALDRLVLHRHPDDKEEILKEIQMDSGKAAKEIMFTTVSKKLKVTNLNGTKALVIGGTHDKIMPVGVQKKIVAKYNCDYKEFPHGHMMMLEKNAGPTVQFILEWLDKIRGLSY